MPKELKRLIDLAGENEMKSYYASAISTYKKIIEQFSEHTILLVFK